ncbi:MAG: AAA family ATPase [Saprospiraceae bacterium]
MILRKAERKQAKIKMALQGSSGSGKTYSALLLARGLTDDWSKVAVVDTENGSAELYAHLGDFKVINIPSPFTPESYIEAMELCEKSGIEVIILDSISHCWDYLLKYHASLTGNSFANWNKVTPRHDAFINRILQSTCHVVATMRTKQDYVLNTINGKQVPEKVGLKAIQRTGLDYEFTIVFDLDQEHKAKVSKDRTSLFSQTKPFFISEATGLEILEWTLDGTSVESVRALIARAESIQSLRELFEKYRSLYRQLQPDFENRKIQLQNQISSSAKTETNGISNHSIQ